MADNENDNRKEVIWNIIKRVYTHWYNGEQPFDSDLQQGLRRFRKEFEQAYKCPIALPEVQVSDTTNDDSSNVA